MAPRLTGNVTRVTPTDPLRSVSAGTGGRLDDRLAREQAEHRIPSLAAGLVHEGALVWSGGAGSIASDADGEIAPTGNRPDSNTQYRIGSISKTFVAVAVMRLRDEGLVDLNDLMSEHLPEVTEPRATIAQYLSHTSGLRAETSGPWWERTPGTDFATLVARSVRPEDTLARPGRRFHYSNVGYAVLGELVARRRGAPWHEVVETELLEPLQMARTTTRPVAPYAHGLGVHPHADVVLAEPEHDAVSMAPAGQLWSTVADLARWARLLSGLHPELLAPETLAEMREPVAVNDLPDQAWSNCHGLGLQLFNTNGSRSFGHLGSMPGHLAALRIDGTTSDAVIVLANATSGLGLELAGDLLGLLHGDRPAAGPAVGPAAGRAAGGTSAPWRPAAGGVPQQLLEITGAWYWGTSGFILSIRGDGALDLHALGVGREASFEPAGDGRFIGRSGYYNGETLEVVRRADGTLSHLDIGSFVFTRSPYDPAAPIPGGVDPAGWTGTGEPSAGAAAGGVPGADAGAGGVPGAGAGAGAL